MTPVDRPHLSRLRALGIRVDRFAAMTGVSASQVRRWDTRPQWPAPPWVGLLLDAWERFGAPT